LDRRGFGLSGGKRGLIEEDWLEDHLQFIDWVMKTKEYPHDIPKFLFGVSTGGLIAFRLCQIKPDYFNGIIPIVPYLGPYVPYTEDQLNALKEKVKEDPYAEIQTTIIDNTNVFRDFLSTIDITNFYFKWHA
jgi:alpha-beta hydrolase superfamily lysophospholipase